jgi:glycosyltransferase involved in cell wall biosynthesis
MLYRGYAARENPPSWGAVAMRVCIATRLTGGVGLYSRTLISALLSSDPDLHLTVVSPEVPDVPMEYKRRLTCHQVSHRLRLPTHPGWIFDAMAFRNTLRRVVDSVDLIHFTDARHALFSTGLNKPIIGTMNDYFYATVTWQTKSVSRFYRDWISRYPLYHLAKSGERRALRKMAGIIAISNAVAETIASAYGIPAARFATVPYGIDFTVIPANDGCLHSTRSILFVGGNFQRKGLLILLQAMPFIINRFPDTKLTIIGESHYAEGVMRFAEELGIAASCDFLGNVSHDALLKYYGSATVFTMPSLMEAFGIPYLEAMSCGLPVVATACQGPDEYLVDGYNALIVPPGDVTALAEALIQLLSDTSLRERLRLGGRSTAREFTPERMARQTLNVYRNVLAEATVSDEERLQ